MAAKKGAKKTAKRGTRKAAKKLARKAAKKSARKGARKAASRRAAPVVGTLGLVTLHVGDIHRAVAFYRDALGLRAKQVIDVPGLGWAEIEVGPGLLLGLHQDKDGAEEGSRPPGGASGFYFQVPDVDKAVGTLRARGVKVVDEPEDKPYGRDACIEDPDGNVLALMTPS